MNRLRNQLCAFGLATLIVTGLGAIADDAENQAPLSRVQQEGRQSQAEERLRKLAKEDNKEAQMQLGEAYLLGKIGLKRDPKEALTWLRQAACEDKRSKRKKQEPEPRAFLLLGKCYQTEEYAKFLKLERSDERALEYYLLAEKYGYTPAALDVAETYQRMGKTKESIEYFKKAADANIQQAQWMYGLILTRGLGVKPAPQDAIPYLEKAAKSGSSDAQLLLAEVYGGKYPGVDRTPRKMVDYLWQAAMTRSDAVARIGYCYQYGIGLPRDPALAVRWYVRAAESEDPSPEALVALAGCLRNGTGIDKNEAKALELYRRAAELKDVPAIVYHNIGSCYAHGIGTKKNEPEAFVYFQKAAEAGVAASMNALGEMYEAGTAIDPKTDKRIKDYKQAFKWYEKAAQAKHPRGMYNLGRCYQEGIGVAVDKDKAQPFLKQGVAPPGKGAPVAPEKKNGSKLKGF